MAVRKTGNIGMERLTDKQRRFCTEYIDDLNAAKAAIRAGYSEHTASRIGPELLGYPWVMAYVSKLQEERKSLKFVAADKILHELMRIAFSDVRDLFKDGRLLPISEMPEDTVRCVASFEVRQFYAGRQGERVAVGEIRKVKLWDKVKALTTLCKHLGLLVNRVEVQTPGQGEAPFDPAAMRQALGSPDAVYALATLQAVLFRGVGVPAPGVPDGGGPAGPVVAGGDGGGAVEGTVEAGAAPCDT